MQIVIANPPDILDNGMHGVVSYPHYPADEIRKVFEQYYSLRDRQ